MSRSSGAVRPAATPKGLWGLLCLGAIYFIIAAAAFNGFFEKWSFRDEEPMFSLAAMLDGTAHRPYVYRHMLPAVANEIDERLPAELKSVIDDRLVRAEGNLEISSATAADDEYALRYRIVYYVSFVALFLGLFVLRRIGLEYFGPLEATAAPALFALMLPLILTIGGYFYDFTEILFMGAAVFVAVRAPVYWLVPLVVLGTLNKESFFFYVVTLWPLLAHRYGWRRSGLLVVALVGLSGCAYLWVRQAFAGNPGDTAQFHLFSNLRFYANPMNLLAFERTYGLPMFRGYSVVMVLLVAVIVAAGWRGLPAFFRQHILLAVVINVPLLLIFCAPGEMRNLSMLYVGLTLLLASALQRWAHGRPSLATATDRGRA